MNVALAYLRIALQEGRSDWKPAKDAEKVANVGPKQQVFTLGTDTSVLKTLVRELRDDELASSKDIVETNAKFQEKLKAICAEHPHLGLLGRYVGPMLRLKFLLTKDLRPTPLSLRALLDLDLADMRADLQTLQAIPHVLQKPGALARRLGCPQLQIQSFMCMAAHCVRRHPDVVPLMSDPSFVEALQKTLAAYWEEHQHAPSLNRLFLVHKQRSQLGSISQGHTTEAGSSRPTDDESGTSEEEA